MSGIRFGRNHPFYCTYLYSKCLQIVGGRDCPWPRVGCLSPADITVGEGREGRSEGKRERAASLDVRLCKLVRLSRDGD